MNINLDLSGIIGCIVGICSLFVWAIGREIQISSLKGDIKRLQGDIARYMEKISELKERVDDIERYREKIFELQEFIKESK